MLLPGKAERGAGDVAVAEGGDMTGSWAGGCKACWGSGCEASAVGWLCGKGVLL